MKKIRFIASVFLTMVLFSCLMINASAEGGEPIPDVVPTPVVDVPGGTGTVIENATEADGKEFYTIMTPDENVFYLIIDRQRNAENVYFLNAVTEADLLPLAEVPPEEDTPVIVPEPTPTPIVSPEPEPEKGFDVVKILLLCAVAGITFGVGLYFLKSSGGKVKDDGYLQEQEDYKAHVPDDDYSWFDEWEKK